MTSQDLSSYVIELTQKLVRCQGEAGDEKPAADLLAAEMRAMGYDRVEIDENGSVVGVIDGQQVIQAVETRPLPAHPTIGQAILALTDIISEPYPGHSVIPSVCRATYDRRLVPGETRESVLASFANLPTIAGASVSASITRGEYSTYTGRRLEADKWFPAWEIERSHPLVQKAARGLKAAGLPLVYDIYQFCTNAAYSAGVAHVPTIGFGPSLASLAHVVDEYITLEDLLRAVRGYEGLILAVLGE
jgi:acetylornithine deacetylase/succinyl-diaminopimelate desuccinylase-like protein